MIQYARTVRNRGQRVRLYDVTHECGGIVFEVAFDVPRDQAEKIAKSVKLAFSERVQAIEGQARRTPPRILARDLRRVLRVIAGGAGTGAAAL